MQIILCTYIWLLYLSNIATWVHTLVLSSSFALTGLAILFVIKYLQYTKRIGLDWVLKLPVANT